MPDAPLLKVSQLEAFYGDFQALKGVSMDIDAGEIVAVVGANGAGKSTLFKTIAGLLASPASSIEFDGAAIGGRRAHEILRRGIALVPEGRRLFSSLSVEENLLIGAQAGRPGQWSLPRVRELFPILAERRHQPSASLSGGQQQMVAIARALMSNPRLLLCDEISLGLSPLVVRDIYAALPVIAAEGLAIAIVEQDIARALAAANRVVCLREGRVALAGSTRDISRENVAAAYFGV